MAVCDICSNPGLGTTIGAADMRKAVKKKNFNPLKEGLIKDPMALAGGDAWYAGWKNMVNQDTSDWNICPRCMAKLEPYLSGKPKARGIKEAGVSGKEIWSAVDREAAGSPPERTKTWWQFWK